MRKSQPERIDVANFKETPTAILYHLARYRFAARLLSKKDVVLDIGCGLGAGTVLLADYCNSVTGIDSNVDAILKAKQRYEGEPWNHSFHPFEAIDYLDKLWGFPHPARFSVVTAIDVIEHLKLPETLVRGVNKYLGYSGMFICGTPRKQDIPMRNESHEHEFEPDEFYELLERYFPRVLRFAQNEETVSVFNLDTAWYLWGVCTK